MALKMVVIATIGNEKHITGYRIMDKSTGNTIDVSESQVVNVLKQKKEIEGLKLERGKIKGSNGSLDRYTRLDKNNLMKIILNKESIVILQELGDDGYKIVNCEAKIFKLTTSALIDAINREGLQISNGKLVQGQNGDFISSINGTYEQVDIKAEREKEKKIAEDVAKQAKEVLKDNAGENNLKKSLGKVAAHEVSGLESGLDLLKKVDEASGLTVEQKVAYMENVIKNLRPFYYYILFVMKKKWTVTDLEKMSVSLDTLYMNPNFVMETPLPELVFIGFHEICHIAMSHHLRMKDRNHDLANVATDLYVNEYLRDEFKLPRDGSVIRVSDASGSKSYPMAFPQYICSSAGLDLATDTPEKIYDELCKAVKEHQNSQGNQGNGQHGQPGQGQPGQGQPGQGQPGQGQPGQGNGNQGKGKRIGSEAYKTGDDKGQNFDKSMGAGNTSSNVRNQSQEFNAPGMNDGKTEKGADKQKGQRNRYSGAKFRGQDIGDLVNKSGDMVVDPNSKVTEEVARQIHKELLSRGMVNLKKKCPGWSPDGADALERYVLESLAPKINWRNLLRKYLTVLSRTQLSWSAPNRRYVHTGEIKKGPKAVGKDNLGQVKICIDTSGSISNEDIGAALAQIKDLLRQYKCEGEILYWDTRIAACYPFKDLQDILKKKPMGCGGTDPNCIFDFFETNRDYKIGKKKKPDVILIFTDGYFGKLDDSYKLKYKNTIWIINNGLKDFQPPFGKVAPFKNND